MPRLSLDRLGQASLLSALPVRIPGCVLWLDAGSLRLTSGDAVGTWTDLSGSGNHATQATAGNKPKYLETADFLTSTEYGTLEFTAPDLITRTVGSWVTDGYNSAGRILTVSGAATAANNGKFTIESATATVLTIVEQTLANEAASTTETVKTNILNGRPVVRFDGSDDYLVSSLTHDWTNNPWTVIAVASLTSDGTTWRGIIGTRFGAGAGNWWTLGSVPGASDLHVETSGIADFSFGFNMSGAGAQIISIVTSGVGAMSCYRNGALAGSQSGWTNIGGLANEVRIGQWLGDAQIWLGDFVELAVYNRALSAAEHQRLGFYLGRKYAITVS